ncbi:MAG: AzlC family ABC transporter permease [Archaeoglobi archaeon]|nr:AzlC family ABC transporter permease [Candidatus Mnemosynella sp.]
MHPLKNGIEASSPIIMGYIPLGFAFGALAVMSGLSVLEASMMSLIVYAGASQFIAVEMISKGADAISIALVTFFVNLRHLLMSTSLSRYLRRVKKAEKIVLAHLITDESFSVSSILFPKDESFRLRLLGCGISAYFSWFLGTLCGAITASSLYLGDLGLEFALPAMFSALLVWQFKERINIAVAILSGALTIALFPLLSYTALFLSPLIASLFGVMVWRNS